MANPYEPPQEAGTPTGFNWQLLLRIRNTVLLLVTCCGTAFYSHTCYLACGYASRSFHHGEWWPLAVDLFAVIASAILAFVSLLLVAFGFYKTFLENEPE